MQFKFNYSLRIGGQAFPQGVQEVPDAIVKSTAFAQYQKVKWIVEANELSTPANETAAQRSARLAAQLMAQKAEVAAKKPASKVTAKTVSIK